MGGIRLQLTVTGRRTAPDSAWNEDGDAEAARYAGASALGEQRRPVAVFTRPGYQGAVRGVTGGRRGVPDVALSASFRGGSSATGRSPAAGPGNRPPGPAWLPPTPAGLVVIADQAAQHPARPDRPGAVPAGPSSTHGIVPVTRGSNTVRVSQRGKTVTVHGYPARAGYSLVTGVGTVDAARFVPELAAVASQP